MGNRWALLLGAVLLAVVGEAASAATVVFTADLSGSEESPPNASPGIGFAEVDFDLVAHTMRVRATFSGLLGTTIAAHIHAATANPGAGTAIVATMTPTFSGFPLGVTSGTFDQTYDSSQDATYSPAFETASGGTAASAELVLFNSLSAGTAYFNIHTTVVPGGEIRGFLAPQAAGAPLPAAMPAGLCLMGALGVAGTLRRRRVTV
jgi:hypothetical protein